MGKMKMKITLRFHLTQVRMAIIEKTNKNKCWQEWKVEELSHSVFNSFTNITTDMANVRF
jgi:hypothetical protein